MSPRLKLIELVEHEASAEEAYGVFERIFAKFDASVTGVLLLPKSDTGIGLLQKIYTDEPEPIGYALMLEGLEAVMRVVKDGYGCELLYVDLETGEVGPKDYLEFEDSSFEAYLDNYYQFVDPATLT